MEDMNPIQADNDQKKKKRRRLGPIRTAVFVVFLGIFVVSAGMLAQNYLEGQKVQEDFSKLTVSGEHDVAALHEENGDIVGWLEIEGTRINYPVMQTPKNPEFYLRRNFQKE